jgi:hypothetical protein
MAITSLIVGILTWTMGFLVACPIIAVTYGIGGLVCLPVLLVGWLVAIFTGNSARQQIRASRGQQTGDGLAIAGVVMGLLGVVLIIVILVLVILSLLGLGVFEWFISNS